MSSPPIAPDPFHDAPDSSLVEFLDAAERVWEERQDLRETCGSLGSSEFWFWLMWHGLDEYPQLSELFYPLPPESLIGRVVGEWTSQENFRKHGADNWKSVRDALELGGFDFDGGGSLLDFGCGCGRILRCFARDAGGINLHGADVDPDVIDWCAHSLPFAKFTRLPRSTPSPLKDSSFDGVYAFSVFSHLPEGAHRLWLEDLHRITRPGATLVITVQGPAAIEQFLAGTNPGLEVPRPEQLREDLSKLEAEGFRFYPITFHRSRFEQNQNYYNELEPEAYGATFILEDYIRRNWLDLFELIGIENVRGWHDFVVLRRV